MKKKIKLLILLSALFILTFSLAVLSACKEAPIQIQGTEGLKFTLLPDGSGYEVANEDVDPDTEELIIPSEHRGLPVTRIADEAFFACGLHFTSIVLPETITSIGELAINRERDTRKTPKITQKSLQMIV